LQSPLAVIRKNTLVTEQNLRQSASAENPANLRSWTDVSAVRTPLPYIGSTNC